MSSQTVTPLSQITRRAPEQGRIRLGVKTSRAMKAIDTFRFTCPSREPLDRLAAVYGGNVTPWEDPKASPKKQWQLITKAMEIRVLLLQDGLTSWMELWGGGGLERRCDGEWCEVAGREDMETVPCICNADRRKACKPTTRLSVVLPDIPFGGTWRMDTKGENALRELPGMHELITTMVTRGRLVEAWLYITFHEKMIKGEKKNFVVPRLRISESFDQLASSAGVQPSTAALVSTSTLALPPVHSDSNGDIEGIGEYGEEIVDAEVVDDELLDLEARLRADASNFGLDPERYVVAVKAQAGNDRVRMADCSAKTRTGDIEPTGFDASGRIRWNIAAQATTQEGDQ